MTTEKYIIYARVSTKSQALDGEGVAAQHYACQPIVRDGEIVAEYVEQASGTRNNRPILAQAIAHAKKVDAVLVVARLDRLARDVTLIQTLIADPKLKLVMADMAQIDTREPGGWAMLSLMAVFAQFESKMAAKRNAAVHASMLADPMKRDRCSSVREREKAKAAYGVVKPAIVKALEDDPGASGVRLAHVLNDAGLKHPRSGAAWNKNSAARARRLLSL